MINAVGNTRFGDRVYYPDLAEDRRDNGRFVPRSENITYANLRNTVVALSDRETPVHYRRRFYTNSPIPGAVWETVPDDPRLANADEIIPENHGMDDLHDDFSEVGELLTLTSKLLPKYISAGLNGSSDGQNSILLSSSQSNLRVLDRNAGEDLRQYYRRVKVGGDSEGGWSTEPLGAAEALDGAFILAGELPVSVTDTYPLFVPRSEEIATSRF